MVRFSAEFINNILQPIQCVLYFLLILFTLGVKNFLQKLSTTRDGTVKSTETRKG